MSITWSKEHERAPSFAPVLNDPMSQLFREIVDPIGAVRASSAHVENFVEGNVARLTVIVPDMVLPLARLRVKLNLSMLDRMPQQRKAIAFARVFERELLPLIEREREARHWSYVDP